MSSLDRRGFISGIAGGAMLTASGFRPDRAQAGTNEFGAWSQPYPWPDVAIHISVLPDNKILTWADDDVPGLRDRNAGFSKAFVVDIPFDGAPSTTWVEIDNTLTNLFCAGHSFLPDGRLLVLGGHQGANNYGSIDATIFEYQNGYRWARQNAPMNAGRWYASALTLPSGEILVLGGAVDGVNRLNPLPQVWQTPLGGGWRDLTTAQLKVFNYPKIYVAPDGRVIHIGTEPQTRYLDTAGTGAWSAGPVHMHPGKRNYGSSVMYDDGKFLVMGGANTNSSAPTNTAEVLDLNSTAPAWQWTQSMTFARKHCVATNLPDGTVLVTGGSSSVAFNDAAGAALAAEVWWPPGGQWFVKASAQVPRVYHSSAVLLPDGRVLVAGGGRPKAKNYGIDNYNVEIFWPHYFGRGPRPVIASAPAALTYGQTFNVFTPNVAEIGAIRLMSYGSTTHAFNMNQRAKWLPFLPVAAENRLWVGMEPDRNRLPPGPYMLFLLSNLGVPSYAATVFVA